MKLRNSVFTCICILVVILAPCAFSQTEQEDIEETVYGKISESLWRGSLSATL